MQVRAHSSQEQVFDLDYLRLAARVWGEADAYPVIALHGWMDNAATFDALAPQLQGIRFIALDLAGHGLSEHRPPGLGYYFPDYLADIQQLVRHLGLQRYSLLGHSMGAALAGMLTAVDERVESLVMIEGIGPLAGRPEAEPRRLKDALGQMLAYQPKPRRPMASHETAAAARTRAGGISLEAAMQLVSRGLEPIDGAYYWRHDPRLAFKSPIYLTEEQIQAFIERIRVPSLLLMGEQGYLLDRTNTEVRCAKLAGLQVHCLEANHYPHIDCAGEAAGYVNAFFGEHILGEEG